MRPQSFALAALVATLTTSTGAFPGPSPRTRTASRAGALGPAALRFGRSIGTPTEGHLIGGSHLEAKDYLRIVPVYTGDDVRWGLEPLVAMIDRAARQVRHQFDGTITSVGHLSREGGGDIDRHRSHESGRDADIGFFIENASKRQLLPSHFVPFRGDATAPSWPGAFFDDARNWALVSALVTDPEAHVTHIFVASPLRARLLAYAERMGAPANVRVRAAELLQQPHGALPHDDHFHVRIGCPAHMTSCVENPTMRHRASPQVVAHGRRDVHGHPTLPPAKAHIPSRVPVAPEVEGPGGGDEPAEPDAPAVVMPVPLDDVDG